ncbi:SGNH/GDSL hydrolase family protein [Nocardioides caeni]|uniref:SGNH/GDSL hydrolase family protein n=1 Tax=Nocardioides caeni TaxID=574700 RepID=A0A4S8N1U4_9ACTN|nr:SGNH/GDSL hydrolase family protein [Nocardioides caeni]THV09883.1 SGNH/GDSL hydrolase family protein [Nocardioides caeni]
MMAGRAVAVAVTAAAAALLLGGCSASGGGGADRTASPSATTAGPSEGVTGSRLRYVALGDSYTAAPGVGEPVGRSLCLRTDANYPHLLARRLDLDLVDVSCSGATSDDLTSAQGGRERGTAPQLDALGPVVDLVTLSIGANDGGLFGDLVSSCAGLPGLPTGQACSATGRFADGRLSDELAALARRTTRSVDLVRDRAPRARVVVVGYPRIVPSGRSCDALPIAAADLAFAHGLNRRIVEAVRRGALRSGVDYVDMWAASRGHDACAIDPWIAGLQPTGPGLPLHPYADHQEAVADELEALLAP